MKSRPATLACALLVFAGANFAQTAPPHVTFDAASIKIAAKGLPGPGALQMKGGPGTADPGRVAWRIVNLPSLLMKAFKVEDYRIIGPDWLTGRGAENFTLEATMPPETTKEQFQVMLQNLLIERFQLRLHHETRTFPGYELIVAPGGPKLKPPTDPDAPEPLRGATGELDKAGFLVLPPGHGSGISLVDGVHESFHSFTMSELVGGPWLRQGLASDDQWRTHIADRTGLTGKYDFTLKFDSRGGAGKVVVGPQVQAAGSAAIDESNGLPDIFKALEKQLGLKLVKVNGFPLDTIFIDHIEKVPTEN